MIQYHLKELIAAVSKHRVDTQQQQEQQHLMDNLQSLLGVPTQNDTTQESAPTATVAHLPTMPQQLAPQVPQAPVGQHPANSPTISSWSAQACP